MPDKASKVLISQPHPISHFDAVWPSLGQLAEEGVQVAHEFPTVLVVFGQKRKNSPFSFFNGMIFTNGTVNLCNRCNNAFGLIPARSSSGWAKIFPGTAGNVGRLPDARGC